MRYYEILKKRRIDLKLSIQDVSAQTRLAPEYIKAIEENDLDVFSDDLSFVRYFIRSYCEALGVNWQMLQEEVDGSIKHYAHLRNMALTQAQKRMVESMPAQTNPSRVRRQKRTYQNHVASTSRSLSRKPRRRLSMKAMALLGALVIGAAGIWVAMDRMNASQEAAAAAAAQQEAKDKEAETARLAQLRRQEQGLDSQPDQEEKETQEDTTTVSGNTVTVTSTFQAPVAITIAAEFPSVTTVWLTQDGQPLNDTSQSAESFEQTVTMEEPGTLLFQPALPEGMKLSVNGQQVDATPGINDQTIVIINAERSQGGQDESAE